MKPQTNMQDVPRLEESKLFTPWPMTDVIRRLCIHMQFGGKVSVLSVTSELFEFNSMHPGLQIKRLHDNLTTFSDQTLRPTLSRALGLCTDDLILDCPRLYVIGSVP